MHLVIVVATSLDRRKLKTDEIPAFAPLAIVRSSFNRHQNESLVTFIILSDDIHKSKVKNTAFLA